MSISFFKVLPFIVFLTWNVYPLLLLSILCYMNLFSKSSKLYWLLLISELSLGSTIKLAVLLSVYFNPLANLLVVYVLNANSLPVKEPDIL